MLTTTLLSHPEKADLTSITQCGIPAGRVTPCTQHPLAHHPPPLGSHTGLLKWGLLPTQSQPPHSIIFFKPIYKCSSHQCQVKNTAQLAVRHLLLASTPPTPPADQGTRAGSRGNHLPLPTWKIYSKALFA